MSYLLFTIIVLIITVITVIVARIRFHKAPYSEVIQRPEVLHVLFPKEIKFTIEQFVHMLEELHNFIHAKYDASISFEFIAGEYGRHFLIVTDHTNIDNIRASIAKYYPDLIIDLVDDYVGFANQSKLVSFVELELTEHFSFPIKTYDQFQIDPQLKLFESLSAMEEGQELWMQVVVRPVPNGWKYDAKDYLQKNRVVDSLASKVSRKLRGNGYQFVIRVLTKSTNRNYARLILQNLQNNYLIFTEPSLNTIAIKPKQTDTWLRLRQVFLGKTKEEKFNFLDRYKHRLLDSSSENIIDCVELASLYHFPTVNMQDLPIKPETQTQVVTTPAQTQIQSVQSIEHQIVTQEKKSASIVSYDIKPTADGDDPLAAAKDVPDPISAEDYASFKD